jgi:predicted transposase YdaD
MAQTSEQPDQPEQAGVDEARGSVPHSRDGLFRRVFGKPVNAASELRMMLPAELVSRLDLDGLTAVNGSFVDSELRWRHSDVLMATRLDGRDALVYVLIEHQSRPDPVMSWRMLRYLVRIWDRYLAEHPKATRLPLIIPVVVHEGPRPWPAAVELSDLIDVDPVTAAVAAEFVPRFRFLLDDLARIDPDELDSVLLQTRPLAPMAGIALFILQGERLGVDVVALLERALGLGKLQELHRGQDGGDDLYTILAYSYQAGDETSADRLRQVVARLGPEAKEAYMTIAERAQARGHAKALTQVLTRKFGELPGTARARIETASVEQLEAWTDRVLSATTLDEIFA